MVLRPKPVIKLPPSTKLLYWPHCLIPPWLVTSFSGEVIQTLIPARSESLVVWYSLGCCTSSLTRIIGRGVLRSAPLIFLNFKHCSYLYSVAETQVFLIIGCHYPGQYSDFPHLPMVYRLKKNFLNVLGLISTSSESENDHVFWWINYSLGH